MSRICLFLLLLHSANAGASEFLRYENGNEEWQGELQTAIHQYRHPSGLSVDLVAAIHIADASYYSRLNDYFAGMDLVLFEMVTDAAVAELANASSGGSSPVGLLQSMLAAFLEVEFQLDGIDYGAANFQHADLTASALRRIMLARDENLFSMFMTLATAQLQQEQAALAAGQSPGNTSMLAIMQALGAEDKRQALKSVVAQELARSGNFDLGAEAESQITLLGERNRVALEKLDEAMSSGRYRQIAIFYGAAHMPGLERELLQSRGFEYQSSRWLTAWELP